MSKVLRATPYTPVFPPSLPLSNSTSKSKSFDSADTSSDEPHATQKPYIDRLKERYILLADLPEELYPPSREPSPEAEKRMQKLRLRMRAARDLRFPHVPDLTLTCVGVRGGDWVGESVSDEEVEYILPETEEEWFIWEQKKKVARDRRRVERMALEHRNKIAKWSEEVEDVIPVHHDGAIMQSPERQRADGNSLLDFPIVPWGGITHTKDKGTTSRYFSPQSPPLRESHQEQSDPVERTTLPMPAAPALEPLPDFSDSFSLPDSPPSLPQEFLNSAIPEDITSTPSFAKKDTHTSTPFKPDRVPDPVLQLSSPISPPRSLGPITTAQTLPLPSIPSKRTYQEVKREEAPSPERTTYNPSTPHAIKRARTMMEPITPTSVRRPTTSQEQARSQGPKRLPTLTALLAASSKKASPGGKSKVKCKPSPSPTVNRITSVAVANFSPSQPTYSMFCPQFYSTQPRARSLPPSPSQPMTSTQSLSPQKASVGTASSGIGFYQSQFNVESKVDEVAAFLNADVWDVEA